MSVTSGNDWIAARSPGAGACSTEASWKWRNTKLVAAICWPFPQGAAARPGQART